ncbi:DUF4238 domain-containing protein [Mycobacterium fragae]|uniref:DUF4238 domain-containing protein n=1 Tax=Mycobacterium fragae TaxID=1260918 RepID=A0A1X1UJ29_9MYCO|nr:DUF4238 domain-containing protein [Mycobacterium fragae]MCV7401285.1 DUF4238 domain-containing protein [Mycobacterium fragae]ORV56791.1 hypothetical protein AWC06_00835 [Mycobacterium fragae]
MAQIARGHHTVPRFYLDRFANDGHQIGVLRLPGDIRYRQSTRDVSVVRDFYNIDNRADPNAVENLIAEIEGEAAAVFRKVLDDHQWPLDNNDRSILATFFGLQRVRAPHQRQVFTEIAEVIASVLSPTGDTDAGTGKADQTNEIKHAHISSMVDVMAYAPFYFGRSWVLIRFSRKRLLTGDAPVSLLPNPAKPEAAVGIGNAWAILFPMSRTTGLTMFQIMAGEKQIDTTADGSTYLAGVFNDATINNTRERIFYHPDDVSMIPSELPVPRAVEISTDHPEAKPDDGGGAK